MLPAIVKWGGTGMMVFGLGLMGYLIYTLTVNGSFSLEWTGERIIGEGEDYSGSEIIGKNTGVVYIKYNCTTDNIVFKWIKDCTGMYALFFNRTDERWIPGEKKVIW